MANEWKRGFASVAWRRFNPGGSPRAATRTHLLDPWSASHTPATLCGSRIPEASTAVGVGDVGEGACVRCAVQAALRTDHVERNTRENGGIPWGARRPVKLYQLRCECGHEVRLNENKRGAEQAHRDHVVEVVKAELGAG